MATPDVFEQLTIPGGRAAAKRTEVRVRLIASETGEGVGYATASGVSVCDERKVNPNSSGIYTVTDMVPNSLITPPNTAYEIVVRFPSGRVTEPRYITVADVAGPLDVADILTDPPGALTSPALALGLAAEVARADAAYEPIGNAAAMAIVLGGI